MSIKREFLNYCAKRTEMAIDTLKLATKNGESYGVKQRIIDMGKDEMLGAYLFALDIAFEEKDELESIHSIYHSILWDMEDSIR